MQSIRVYLSLSKPGIIFGNAVTAFGGFALGTHGLFNLSLFLEMLVGLSLIIASACSFNNYIDQAADQKMTRTQNRALVKGEVAPAQALLFGAILGVLGSLVLLLVGILPLAIALCGFAVYVFVYSPLKYKTHQATLVGSIAGAAPPVVGYCALSGSLDLGALLVFALVFLWQMPHFFAIALYRSEDYALAAIPVFPLVKGIKATKVQILFYVLGFTAVSLLFPLLGYTRTSFLFLAATIGMIWVVLALWGFFSRNDKKWARSIFLFSLIAVMTLCAAMLLN